LTVAERAVASDPETGPRTTARVLEGRGLAAEIRGQVRRQVGAFRRRYGGYSPTLAAVMVGRELASSVYLQQIMRTSAAVGVPSRIIELPRSTTADELRAQIEALNGDREVAGIIVQQPLPRHIPLSTVTDTILPAKDIDGIHPLNTGLMTLGYEGFLPACAEAAVEIPKFYGYELRARGPSSSGAATWWASPCSYCSCASTAPSRSAIGGRATSSGRSGGLRSWSRPPALLGS